MFIHQGKTRTLKHNLRIATLLSFVAGIVNVTGFLAFKQFTTNVTGHFALFMNDVADFAFWEGTIYLLFIFSFLFGSFFSGFLIEKYKESKRLNVFILPALIEATILISIGLTSNFVDIGHVNAVVCLLLFTMGLQNSFVTKISDAVVRTTHLTGLFTDLGIDISQLFFSKLQSQKVELRKNIWLRSTIISSFFAGGIMGGLAYTRADLKLNTLIIAGCILLISMFYDDFKNAISSSSSSIEQKNLSNLKRTTD